MSYKPKLFKFAFLVFVFASCIGSPVLFAQSPATQGSSADATEPNVSRAMRAVTVFAATAMPTFTTINPTSGVRATSLTVTLSGSAFDEQLMVLDGGTGITISDVRVTNATTATANFAISATASLGSHLVTLKNNVGFSETRIFTVLPPPPALHSVTPSSGTLGSRIDVTLTGANFVSGMTVNAGADITVRNLSVLDSTTAKATFLVDTVAVLGVRDLTVTTAGGTTGPVPFTVLLPPIPTLSSLSPASGVPNATVSVTLTGMNFLSGMAVEAIEGVTVSGVEVVDSQTARVTFAIAAEAILGSREVRVTTVGGTSAAVLFAVVLVPPALMSINPASGGQGATVNVTLTGSNFTPGLTIDAFPGITISNIAVTNSLSATATFAIDPLAVIGPRDVRVATSGGISGSVPFSVTPPPPTLTSVDPASGLLGTSLQVVLIGTNFFAPLSIDAGPSITVAAITLVDSTTATATFSIGLNATPGINNITLTTSGGSVTASLFSVIPFPPTLTGISPSSIIQVPLARSFQVTLTGTNLFSPTVSISGTGVRAPANVNVTSGTSGTSIFTVDDNAAIGPREVTISTEGGTSMPVLFTVLPPTPTLTDISPAVGVRGRSVNVTLTGTNFSFTGTTLNSIPGITVTNVVVVNAITMTATFGIDANAAIGPRSVTVTTAFGTTEAFTFQISDPFPDLSIKSSHVGRFGVGFNESYSVTVANVGTAQSVGAITVTDTLPPGLTYVSSNGTDWSCSAISQTVTCTSAVSIGSGASSSYSLTVAVGTGVSQMVNHSVSVASSGDLNLQNNSATDLTNVVPTPSLAFAFKPLPVVAAEQAELSISSSRTFPHDIVGAVTLAFEPSAAIPADDPAIQFATGGRTLEFTIPADTNQARFGTASSVGFQTGTVAGKLAFSGTFSAGAVQGSFSPSAGSNTPTIASQAPVIQGIETSTENGFVASVQFYSTTREVIELNLTFDTKPRVTLSCGAAAGCSVSNNILTFDVSQQFATWFATDNAFGGLGLLNIPLNIQGAKVRGQVSVSLRNKEGNSIPASFSLP